MAKPILHTIKKILIWLFLSVLVLVIASLTLVYFKAPGYLNNNLSNFVKEKTGGLYDLQFDHLGLSYRHWGFEIENVKLQAVDSVVQQLDSIKNNKSFYYFSSPKINVKGIHFLRYLKNKELIISGFEVVEPNFRIKGSSNDEQIKGRNLESLFDKLAPAFRKRIRSLTIKQVELVDANYDLYSFLGDTSRVSNAENITIGLTNFYTDSLLLPDPKRMFDADDVFIKMANYENKLSDSLHVLNAEELLYSFKKEHITGKNVELKAYKKRSDKNRYFVKVPFLKVKSKYLHEFYYSDSIRIDSLYLEQPKIEFYPRRKSKTRISNFANLDLYDLVKQDFKFLSINDFSLKKATLKLFNYNERYYQQQELNNLKLELWNFQLDSLATMKSNRIFYSDDISVEVENYWLKLGDNKHLLETKKLLACSKQQIVSFNKIHVEPQNESLLKEEKDIAIFVDCDSLKLAGANLKHAYQNRGLPVSQIQIFKPVTTINNYGLGRKGQRSQSSLAYELISEYFKGVYANLVTMEKGSMVVNSKSGDEKLGYIQTDIGFHLTDFALDSISAARSDKLFFATNINLSFSNYKMQLVDQLHQLNIEKIDVSSMRQKASVTNLHLFPVSKEDPEEILKNSGRSELYEVKVPYLFFYNTDIHQALFNKKLTIGNFRIVEPKIDYINFAKLKPERVSEENIQEFFDLMSNYITDVDIRRIELKSGKVRLTNHSRKGKTIVFDNKMTLKLDRFRLNKYQIGKRKLLFSRNIDLRIDKYLFKLSDNVHYLQAGEIGLSTFDNHVYVKDAIFYPDITNPKYKELPWNIHIKIPMVSLSGVDLPRLYFDHVLMAEEFGISKPDIKMYRMDTEAKKIDFKQLELPLPKELQYLSINRFHLDDGSLDIYKTDGLDHKDLISGEISMQSRNLAIESSPKGNSALVKSGIFNTRLSQLVIQPPNKNQTITVESINYSTSNKNVVLKNLDIVPRQLEKVKNQYKLNVPELTLESFDIDAAYIDNIYKLKAINLLNPEFTFYKNTKDTVGFNPFATNLYRHFSGFADEFSAKILKLNNATFNYIRPSGSVTQKGVDLQLKNFKLNGESAAHKFLNSEEFLFNFKDVVRYDKNKWYRFEIDNISFSSADNDFVASGLRVVPKYSRSDFPKIVGHQLDHFNGRLKELRFGQLDLKRWFDKSELVGNTIMIDGLHLDVHRDKRVKFNEKQRPAMPHDLMKDFELEFYFDSLLMKNSDISYAERIKESLTAGKIDFTDVNVSLKPFTNIPYLFHSAKNVEMDVNGRLMGKPLISAKMNFDLTSVNNQFEVNGSIEPFSLEILNPMVEPAALMSISSGDAKRFEFQFSGDNDIAKGKLKFAYDDLKISILEIKDGSTKRMGFSSFMANSLMIKSKNPRGKILLSDEIDYQQDPSRSILNYWWKSIFDGVKNTFGIKDKKQN